MLSKNLETWTLETKLKNRTAAFSRLFVGLTILDMAKSDLRCQIEGFGDDFGFGFWAGKPDRGSPPCTQKKSTAEKKTPPLDAHLRSEIRSIGVNGF